MPEIDVLKVLDEMDKFRREHQDEKISSPDWCMRVLEAILANIPEFCHVFISVSKIDKRGRLYKMLAPETFYSKDYDPQLGFHK